MIPCRTLRTPPEFLAGREMIHSGAGTRLGPTAGDHGPRIGGVGVDVLGGVDWLFCAASRDLRTVMVFSLLRRLVGRRGGGIAT